MKKVLIVTAVVLAVSILLGFYAATRAAEVDSVKMAAKIDSLKAVRSELGREIGRVTNEIYTLKTLCGDTLNIITGSRGGRYYINAKGRKVYIKSKVK